MERVISVADRTLLYGPPGTGKTTVATAGAGTEDRPVYVVPMHEESTVAELIGHFVPVGDRFVWLDGPALAAWRQGARLVIDEIDLASGAVLSVLRSIMNDRRVARLTVPNREMAGASDEELARIITSGEGLETVYPGDGFQVVATMNGEPQDLDEPLVDRFDAKFYVGEPHPNAINALPAALRATARRTAMQDDARRISVRRWFAFVNLAKQVGTADAGFAVFGTRAGDILDGLRLGDVLESDGKVADKAPEPAAPAAAPAARPETPKAEAPDVSIEDPAARVRADRLRRLPRADLRKIAGSAGLPVYGHKELLVKRLAEAGVDA